MEDLTVDDGERDAKLCGVVGRHDGDVAVGHRETELVEGDDDIGHDEADRSHAAA